MNVILLHIASNHIQSGDNKNTGASIFCRMHSTIKNHVEPG